MTSGLLAAMVAAARRTATERERGDSRAHVERAAETMTPRGRLFEETLRRPGLRVIAECKRRSPSRGVLRPRYDPVAIAASYENGGAAAISVLTESTFFDGSLDHLRGVRRAVTIPLLRKDFIVSEFQIAEARAAGADAVLLIVATLDQKELARLIATADGHALAALVEVHDRDELARALDAGARVIGVNSRDLRTLDVDVQLFDRLAPHMSNDVVGVAESGLKSLDELMRLHRAGYKAFLIGERFMTTDDPGAALAGLLQSESNKAGTAR